MNILIPMAGNGQRFKEKNYSFPKPLIDVNGKPMIQLVVDNLNLGGNFIYIVQKKHYEEYNLHNMLNLITPGCKIIQVDKVTEGAACTSLLAKDLINNDEQLLIANSDQYIEYNPIAYMYSNINSNVDGSILTFKSSHVKWSYAKTNEYGRVIEVAEKNPISNHASCGIYWWLKGSDYVKYAEQMISKNIRTNNEYYIAPVYNEAILDNKIIKIYNVDKMAGLGTPEDLEDFKRNYK